MVRDGMGTALLPTEFIFVQKPLLNVHEWTSANR